MAQVMKKVKTSYKILWITLAILALGLSGAYFFLIAPDQAEENSAATQVSRVRQGDIRIMVSGSGEIVAQEEIDLGFNTAGILGTLHIEVGDKVEAGEPMAQLDTNQVELTLTEAELVWDQVSSPAAIADAEQALYQAEVDLEQARKELLILNAGPYIPTYQTRYDLAVEAYQDALQKMRTAKRPQRWTRVVEQAEEAVAAALEELIWVQTYQAPEVAMARTMLKVDLASANLNDQETLAAILHGTPLPDIENSAIGPAVIALQNASISLQTAQDALAKTELFAPFDGTVTAIHADENETLASGAPVITLTTVDQLKLHFYLDESDIAWVSIGDALEVHLSAFPDITIEGIITGMNPVMIYVDRTWVVELWAEVNAPSTLQLIPGMSADVEVIAAETNDAVLIPLQALIEGADGSYQVAIILDDDSVEYRQVSVGLRDFANVEILSGLASGEKVSTTPDLLIETLQ
jgi:RND family efflux transporter MFP subunit